MTSGVSTSPNIGTSSATGAGGTAPQNNDPQLQSIEQQMQQDQVNSDAFQAFATGVNENISSNAAAAGVLNSSSTQIAQSGRA